MNIDANIGLQQLLYLLNKITAVEIGGLVQYSTIDNLSIMPVSCSIVDNREFSLWKYVLYQIHMLAALASYHHLSSAP